MALILGSGDTKFDTADDFLGGKLVALKQIIKYGSPNGLKKGVINAGAVVGTIESYVEPGDGSVWWMLTDKTFVKQSEGNFDKEIVRQSVLDNEKTRQTEIDKEAAKRQINLSGKISDTFGNVTDFIGDFGKHFKWILIFAICIVLIAVFIRISGK